MMTLARAFSRTHYVLFLFIPFLMSFVFVNGTMEEYRYKKYYFEINSAIASVTELQTQKHLIAGKNEIVKLGAEGRVTLKSWIAILLLDVCKSDQEKNDFLASITVVESKNGFFVKELDRIGISIDDRYLHSISFADVALSNQQKYESLDSLLMLDNYMAGESYYGVETFCRYQESTIDGSKVPSILSEEILSFYNSYGLFGKDDCLRCESITTLFVHISSFKEFSGISHIAKKLLLENRITPNQYAWIYDRNYSQEFGTNYYYFSLNDPPMNSQHYKEVSELSRFEIETINLRRDSIGIPPLPYKFTFISPAAF